MKSKSIEKPAVEMREVPPVDKGPLPPVEFVKHWIAMFGDFKDGKLEKAKVMQPKDLSVDDAKYLINAGICIEKIAAIYRIRNFSEFKANLVKHGLLEDKVSAPSDEIWFSESKSFNAAQYDNPVLKINKNGISLNAAFCKLIGDEKYVHLGVTPDNRIKIKFASDGLKLQKTSEKSSTKRVSCAPLMHLLAKRNIKIPATFKMSLDESESCWIGVLMNEESKA